MQHARELGYPVPEVFEVTADSLVLERIDGPTMLDAVLADPSRLDEHARVLAGLHEELHRIEAPERLTAVGDGDRLLHLDLHPENVILSPSGPVVIDWANARRGAPPLDVAQTWVIVTTSNGTGQLGRDFIASFLTHFDRSEVLRHLPVAAEQRLADENVLDEERERIRALASEHA